MKKNIMIGTYNNYFNRIVKVDDYQSILTAGANWIIYPDINFNPSDNVNTSLILNFNAKETNYGNFDPDYLLVLDDDNTISQRWFIMDLKRTRNGQYNFTLRRDLLADYKRDVLDATTFIEKGFVTTDNPLIFNKEDCAFNQIKKSEIALRDKTANGWIVGYVAADLADKTGAAIDQEEIEINYAQEVIPDISTFEFSEYLNKEIAGPLDLNQSGFQIQANAKDNWSSPQVIRYLNNTAENKSISNNLLITRLCADESVERVMSLDLSNIDIEAFEALLGTWVTQSDYKAILEEKDKVYNDNGIFKKVVFNIIQEKTYLANVTSATAPRVIQTIKNSFAAHNIVLESPPANNTNVESVYVKLVYNTITISLEIEDAPFTTAKAIFKNTNRKLFDAPYRMFCIPVADNSILRYNEQDMTIGKNKQLQIAASLAIKLGSNLYDIQLLPYCPIADKFTFTTDVHGSEYLGGNADVDYTLITNSSNEIIDMIFWCPYASFTTNIITQYLAYPDLNINNPVEFKTGALTNKMRLVAPNYANFEDFNYFMNYGVDYINVDCTYKPLTPYIKLNINYKGLYGEDFNDSRGLICGGDYSLPIMSDAWVNYQIQNKNYANIFERETQHLEIQNKWNLASSITGALFGTVQGAAIGSLAGQAGTIAGGIGAGLTGALDIAQTANLQSENMDYRRDLYNMNLQNIQALPQGLVKTSAFNYNSRVWPFLEIYTCTDVEKELLRNKLKYDGMTLKTIGQIKNYLNPSDLTYIQGKIIRLTSILEDYHLVSEINKELTMGVYL